MSIDGFKTAAERAAACRERVERKRWYAERKRGTQLALARMADGDTIGAYDALFHCMPLMEELEKDNLTGPELMDRLIRRDNVGRES